VCQQWFSIAGLFCDIVGFLIIAFEWRYMFWREHEQRQYELHADYEKYSAELRGEEHQDPRGADYTMAKESQRRAYLGANCSILGLHSLSWDSSAKC
jgi:hypothetical protein